mmetsp:Transcript_33073/g.83127  ORF Transcript_33073/g.83127 Transcript_33073/m.83127 type:complete len:390 (+) Transcript_33073:76-1245(+)|eukprot:CAMPEP_0177634662 /NCGR_PEP_ID=MMETSP0447-20121125/3487_1 /TAXON_ID=0 /ORGANISM="Stygamoeba regulata, Strain BSH-02190019" /LENGTH=389 /DNA_ID=CAMNT_0019136397 /DNA_START=32 /DNA_END=1201 /DNA_ORIENTATION=-
MGRAKQAPPGSEVKAKKKKSQVPATTSSTSSSTSNKAAAPVAASTAATTSSVSSRAKKRRNRAKAKRESSQPSSAPALSLKAPAKKATTSAMTKKSSAAAPGPRPYKNRTKTLVFASRNINSRDRHLMEDLRLLMPHQKTEAKLEKKNHFSVINEICELKNCDTCLFFESRKEQDLYLWAAISPNGPTAKFLVTNIHTMDELRLTGNCLMGSRPILSFDPSFDEKPHLQVLKSIFGRIFNVPKYHPQSKPFFDHVMTFSVVDNCVWFRHYQILETPAADGSDGLDKHMVEIGPRFVLHLIRIFDSGFGGATLYENPSYIAPNTIRAYKKRQLLSKYDKRKHAESESAERSEENQLPLDPVNEVFRADVDAMDEESDNESSEYESSSGEE